MKKTAIPLAAFFVSAICAEAVVPAPSRLTVSSDITVVSDHIFRGINRAGTSIQPNIEVAHPADAIPAGAGGGDLFAGVWGNLPTGDGENELRYYGGIALVAPQVDLVSFEAGLTVYHFPGTGSNRNHEVFVGAHLTFPERPALRGSLFYFYDMDSRSHVGEGRLTWSRGLEHLGLPAAIDFSLLGGPRGGGRRETRSYWFYGGAVDLALILSDNAMASLGVGYETADAADSASARSGRSLFWRAGFGTFF